MDEWKVRAEIMKTRGKDGSYLWAMYDDESGKLLDDNSGLGYGSRYSAYEGWYEKLKEADAKKEIMRRKRLVHEWIEEKHLIYRLLEDAETMKLNAGYFRNLLDRMLIEEETLPFSCSDLAHWWNG